MGTVSNRLNSTTLIRGVYRALLNTGRTYAAFEPRHMRWVDSLRGRKEVLDPMAGYGGIMRYCSTPDYPITAYSIEQNPPAYFWQVLTHPGHASIVKELCHNVLDRRKNWPRPHLRIAVSDSWFPEESLPIIESLWHLVMAASNQLGKGQAVEFSLALLLPFVGRLSSTIQGNVVTHVKKGGLCVYHGWQKDFAEYISALLRTVQEHSSHQTNKKHVIRLGDARTIRLGNKRFKAMITSPPYPNSRDYSKIFAPENAFLRWLNERGLISSDYVLHDRVIGGSDVSTAGGRGQQVLANIKSNSATEFLKFIAEFKGSRTAEYDNSVYYLPYYRNYFHGLEIAYENIARYLSKDFVGYVIVVNNTARKRVIPVAKFMLETWRRLGFDAQIEHDKELSHMGGINPRVKGLSARHVEYTIKVKR